MTQGEFNWAAQERAGSAQRGFPDGLEKEKKEKGPQQARLHGPMWPSGHAAG
jgi:hypothetical protein